MSLGHLHGGAVRLAAATETLVLCEGIEDGLTLLQATALPVWATLGTAGLAAVLLPETVRTVLIAADNDANNAGVLAAEKLAARLKKENRRVVAYKPAGAKDFNDLVRKSLKPC